MKRWILPFIASATTLAILAAGVLFGLYIYISTGLPSITKVHDFRMPQVTTVYARDGSIMGEFYDQKRYLVALDSLPKHLINAFLAAEDASFFDHQGFDFRGIIRAFLSNLRKGEKTVGGSTITQQVIKRTLLTPEKSYIRKLQELLLASQLERYLTKDEILYLYVNEIFFGSNAYGIEAAARTFFAKHANELTIAEAALLAGLPQAPSSLNPFRNPASAQSRQIYVLGQMHDKGFITTSEFQKAQEEKLNYLTIPSPTWSIGAWYLEEVRRRLIDFFKEENVRYFGIPLDIYGRDAVMQAGLQVHTAMDPTHQINAEYALRYGLHQACKRRGWRGPIETIGTEQYNDFLQKNTFAPHNLENANWARALVIKVTKDQATVRLGADYTGTIAVKTLGWARVPNTNVSPEYAKKIQNVRDVLSPGDIIWVSAIGAKGTASPVSVPASDDSKKIIPAYDATKIKSDTPIPLALEQLPDLEGAIASIETTSADLVALVGGYQFSPESQFNRATQALRQPGSAFKPIVYSAALDYGFGPGTIILDEPFVLPAAAGRAEWRPKNFDGKYLGPMPLITALAKSRNTCTVRLAHHIGIEAVVQRASDLGITGIPPFLAVSLGSHEVTPLGIAEAYTPFANDGLFVKPRLITKIQNSWHEDMFSFPPNVHQAISPQNAYVMSYLLKEVAIAGTAARSRVLARPIAGKTGTSNEERDAWFIGFSPQLVTSVYIGYDNFTSMGRLETGGRAALPVFIKYRESIDHLYPPDDFIMPPGVSMESIDLDTGYLASPGARSRVLPYIDGTQPYVTSGDPFAPLDSATEGSIELWKQY